MSFNLQHDGGEAADKTEREAMHRSHSQLPYFLGRPAQDHAVIKSGYCVKQGAVVSICCSVVSLWFHFAFWHCSMKIFSGIRIVILQTSL